MLKKLIKHDFRGMSRVLFPLQIGVLAATLLATLLTTTSLRLGVFQNGSELTVGSGMYTVSALTLSVLLGMCVIASGVATMIIICAYFSKNFLGDEGYLTFTLPVKTNRLVASKLICGMLWMIINFVVICIAGLLYCNFGLAYKGVINMDVLGIFGQMFSGIGELSKYVSVPLLIVEVLLWLLTTLAAGIMEIYFAIIVGGQVAKKHKAFAGIGILLLINFLVGIVKNAFRLFSVGTGSLNLLFSSNWNGGALFQYTIWMDMAIAILLAVGFFIWSSYILNKKLNLQ